MPIRPALVSSLVLVLALSACASTGGPRPQRSGAMVAGGEQGLGLTGAETPPALKAMVAAPYALATPPDCGALAAEIAQIDALLGPDVDVLLAKTREGEMGRMAGNALTGAVRGAIPYRWALRWITQAGRLDRELRAAILVGTARRGYLKGVRAGLACPATAPLGPPASAGPIDAGQTKSAP